MARVPRDEAQRKANMALEMRLRGCSYDQIAEKVGWADPSGAYRAVMRLLERTAREPAEHVRKLELQRLDKMLRDLETGKVDPVVVAASLRIQERRARLLGLDAPTKQEVTGAKGGPIRVESSDPDPERISRIRALVTGIPIAPLHQTPQTTEPINGDGDNGHAH